MLKILWHSVAPFVYSGYGIVTRNVALRLAKHYPLLISTYYGLQPGASIRVAGVRVVPTEEFNLGERTVKHYIQKFGINLPILASDFWPFKWFAELPNSMFYGPVDSFDYTSEDIEVMRTFTFFVPCSQFGAKVFKSLTGRSPTAVIPHGVDTKVYRPLDKSACRKLFNFPDKFIFGTVAANADMEPRKGWDDLLVTLAMFKDRYPSEANNWLLFAFTKPSDPRGFNLVEMVKRLGLHNNVLFPEHIVEMVGLPEAELAKLYNCFDVFINSSRREGFCLPVIEAQACGVPVIVPDTSALVELVSGHGWLVRTSDIVFTPRGWLCRKVDREDLLKAIEQAYFDSEKREKYSQLSHSFARQFDWNRLVKKHWLPMLEELSSECLNKIASS